MGKLMTGLFIAACILVGYFCMIKPVIGPLAFLMVGAFGLWQGADKVVEAGRRIAESMGISHVLVGLTLISIGTSLPEIFTSIFSGLNVLHGNTDASGIAVGTTIGSCLTQITLILGITGLVRNVHSKKKTLMRDGAMVLLSILTFFVFSADGIISDIEGLVMIIVYFVYFIYITQDEKSMIHLSGHRRVENKAKLALDLLLLSFGLGLLIFSADLVVDSATGLAARWGVATSFVGVMLIGVCTGLPELSTAITGMLKDAEGISVGTLIGSNITDPLFSLSIGAIIAGSSVVGGFIVDRSSLLFYIPFWFFATAFALYLINRKRLTLDRWEAGLLIVIYLFFAGISWKIGMM